MSKTGPGQCRFFKQGVPGSCRRGAQCKFNHDGPVSSAAPVMTMSPRTRERHEAAARLAAFEEDLRRKREAGKLRQVGQYAKAPQPSESAEEREAREARERVAAFEKALREKESLKGSSKKVRPPSPRQTAPTAKQDEEEARRRFYEERKDDPLNRFDEQMFLRLVKKTMPAKDYPRFLEKFLAYCSHHDRELLGRELVYLFVELDLPNLLAALAKAPQAPTDMENVVARARADKAAGKLGAESMFSSPTPAASQAASYPFSSPPPQAPPPASTSSSFQPRTTHLNPEDHESIMLEQKIAEDRRMRQQEGATSRLQEDLALKKKQDKERKKQEKRERERARREKQDEELRRLQEQLRLESRTQSAQMVVPPFQKPPTESNVSPSTPSSSNVEKEKVDKQRRLAEKKAREELEAKKKAEEEAAWRLKQEEQEAKRAQEQSERLRKEAAERLAQQQAEEQERARQEADEKLKQMKQQLLKEEQERKKRRAAEQKALKLAAEKKALEEQEAKKKAAKEAEEARKKAAQLEQKRLEEEARQRNAAKKKAAAEAEAKQQGIRSCTKCQKEFKLSDEVKKAIAKRRKKHRDYADLILCQDCHYTWQVLPHAVKLKEQGNERFKHGQFEEATRLYTEAIRIAPNEVVFYLNRAASFLGQRKFSNALQDAMHVIESEPANEKARIRASRALLSLDRISEAKNVLQEGIGSGELLERELDIVVQFERLLAEESSNGPRKQLKLLQAWKEQHPGMADLLIDFDMMRLLAQSNQLEVVSKILPEFNSGDGKAFLGKAPSLRMAQRLHCKALVNYFVDGKDISSVMDVFKEAINCLSGLNVEFQADVIRKDQEKINAISTILSENPLLEGVDLVGFEPRLAKSPALPLIYFGRVTLCLNKKRYEDSLRFCALLFDCGKDRAANAYKATFDSMISAREYVLVTQLATDALCDRFPDVRICRITARSELKDHEGCIADVDAVFKTSQRSLSREVRTRLEKLRRDSRRAVRKQKLAENNHYITLGVQRTASQVELKKAFKKLALEHHPDKSEGQSDKEKEESIARFRQVKEAYEVLRDEATRRDYDKTLDEGYLTPEEDDFEDGGFGFGMPMNFWQFFFSHAARRGGFARPGSGFHDYDDYDEDDYDDEDDYY